MKRLVGLLTLLGVWALLPGYGADRWYGFSLHREGADARVFRVDETEDVDECEPGDDMALVVHRDGGLSWIGTARSDDDDDTIKLERIVLISRDDDRTVDTADWHVEPDADWGWGMEMDDDKEEYRLDFHSRALAAPVRPIYGEIVRVRLKLECE